MKLKRQLHDMGAGEFESKDLARLADQLGGLKFRGLRPEARDEIARIPDGKKHFYVPVRWAMAGSMAVVLVTVFGVAQTARPGSALYAVKIGAEKARTVVQPSYTDTIVEKRKEEVQQLQKEAAPAPAVKKAEDSLKKAEENASKRKKSTTTPSSTQTQQNNTRRTRNRNLNNWRWQGSGTNNINTENSGSGIPQTQQQTQTDTQTQSGSTSSGSGSTSGQ